MNNTDRYITDNTEYACDYFYVTKQIVINRKTPIYHIFEYNMNLLGNISWYSKWRRYCFYPDANTIWDSKCLYEVQVLLDKLNSEHKNGDVK